MSRVLIDIEGTQLSKEDCELIKHPATAGIVLFSRNYETPEQLAELTQSICQCKQQCLVAVDQEGGRVQRFVEGFTRLPSMRYWGERYKEDAELTKQELAETLHTMCTELDACGINFCLAPVLDLDHEVSEIIGERSFSADTDIVIDLASIVINILHSYKMPAIGKHFPGHGAVIADSHKELPIDLRESKQIFQQDIKPFAALANQLDAIMPAHVIYQQCDDLPATFSRYWLEDILRKQFGFKGLIISDDLSMQATTQFGGYAQRAKLALAAGCDIVTVCNNRLGASEILNALEVSNGINI